MCMADGNRRNAAPRHLQRMAAMRKLQIPSSNIQRSSKLQTPTPSAHWFWRLVVGASLELGCWSLELYWCREPGASTSPPSLLRIVNAHRPSQQVQRLYLIEAEFAYLSCDSALGGVFLQ